MAAVAAAMRDKGFVVTGSDQNVYPPMSTFLAAKEVEVMQGYAESNLARKPDLVVIGNAISRGNPEAEAVLEQKLRYCSLPELLKEFFIRGKRSLVVSGTHGKTTTTSLLAWVFEHNGLQPGFLIGGIPTISGRRAVHRQSVVHHRGGRVRHRLFRQAQQICPLPAGGGHHQQLEFDHADIFENLGAIQTSFKRLINLIPRNGQLLANGDDPTSRRCSTSRIAPSNASGLGRQQRPGLQSALRPDGQRV
jgi:UDP-N-acetylmuramate: L-alanyl-gamma-D-glutamyl-meso-diaminopimelate ligase